MAPVFKDHILYVPNTLSVHKDLAANNLLFNPGMTIFKLNNLAVLNNYHPFGRNPHLLGKASVPDKVAVFAVDWHKVSRLYKIEHNLQFLLACVARYVDLRNLFVYDLGAPPVKVVHHARYCLFVPGYEF